MGSRMGKRWKWEYGIKECKESIFEASGNKNSTIWNLKLKLLMRSRASAEFCRPTGFCSPWESGCFVSDPLGFLDPSLDFPSHCFFTWCFLFLHCFCSWPLLIWSHPQIDSVSGFRSRYLVLELLLPPVSLTLLTKKSGWRRECLTELLR